MPDYYIDYSQNAFLRDAAFEILKEKGFKRSYGVLDKDWCLIVQPDQKICWTSNSSLYTVRNDGYKEIKLADLPAFDFEPPKPERLALSDGVEAEKVKDIVVAGGAPEDGVIIRNSCSFVLVQEATIEALIEAMQKKHHVKIPNAHFSEAVQKTLFDKGFTWASSGRKVEDWPIKRLHFGLDSKRITYSTSNVYDKDPGLLSLEEFASFFELREITGRKVQFEAGRAKFGDITVSFEDLRKIEEFLEAK